MDPPGIPVLSESADGTARPMLAGELYDMLDAHKRDGGVLRLRGKTFKRLGYVPEKEGEEEESTNTKRPRPDEEGVMLDLILNKSPRAETEEVKVKYSTCNDADEDILDKANDTGTPLFPRYPKLKELYQQHKGTFWDVGEVRGQMHKDRWDELQDEERQFVSFLLIFFLKVDSIIMKNVGSNFQEQVAIFAGKQFYAYQNADESIHSDTYALWVETYLKNKRDIDALIERVEALPSMQKKRAFCEKYMDPKLPFVVRLIAFSVVEGIFFSGAFAGIFWFRKRGKLDGLAFGNGLIFRDEGFHVRFADELVSYIKNRPLPEEIAEIVREGVAIETEFMEDAIVDGLVGMNADLMSQYVRYIGDLRMASLGEKPIYGTQSPFDFMELTSVHEDFNAFEKGVTSYRKASSVDMTLDLAEAFRD